MIDALPNPFAELSTESVPRTSVDQEAAAVFQPPPAAAAPDLGGDDICEIFTAARRLLEADRFVLDEAAFAEALDDRPLFLRAG